jgi:hypothetical protein
MSVHVVTLATAPTLPQARVLARSVHAHEPDWSVTVALVGGSPQALAAEEPFEVVAASDVIGPDLPGLVQHHSGHDLFALLAPRLLLWCCAQGRVPALHLAPTTWVCGPLDPVRAALERQGSVLVPRAAGTLPDDGLDPSHLRLIEEGRLASGFIGVDGSEQSREFLQWWSQRLSDTLSHFGLDSSPRVEPDDRRWAHQFLDLAPARFGAAALDDPGCNLSMWNLHQHSLERREEGIVVDGQVPLRFLDLAGFEPDSPYRLNVEATRIRASRLPILRDLLRDYARELEEAGWRDLERRLEVGRQLANGMVFTDRLRTLHAEALAAGESFGDIFAAEGTRAFIAWLHGPAPEGAGAGISRYLYRVYRDRPDLPQVYPDLEGPDGTHFAAWCWVFGQQEMDIEPQFLPPRPAHVDTPARRLPRVEVRVCGYLGHALGLGAAARGYVQALRAADVPVTTMTVGLTHVARPLEMAAGYGEETFADGAPGPRESSEAPGLAEHGFDLVCVNPDELPEFANTVGDQFFGERPSIGVWGWETNSIPERWAGAFERFDEIWVYSRFMAENLSRVAPVPVVPLPPPVHAPADTDAPLRLGTPEGCLFLFVFDYLSTIQRKNPVGLIRAFQRAFAPGDGPQLLIKTLNGPLRPHAVEEVLWACDDRPDIHVVDRSLTAAQRDALMATCDCYVSLHRSEGLGLTMAECMALGKPVIATGYSGNVDFMTPTNSYLVDYATTRVGPD